MSIPHQKRALKAIADNDATLLSSLIAKDAKLLTSALDDGEHLIHLAVRSGNTNVVREVVSAGADVNVRSESDDESTPLCIAIKQCAKEVAEFLLSCDADMYLGQDGFDSMYIAIEGGEPCHLTMIDVLIGHGYDLDRGDPWTPLMTSCQKRRMDIAEKLLAAGADVNAVTRQGTALHLAVETNQPRFVKLFLDRGVDTSIKAPGNNPDYPGLTAIEAAEKSKKRSLIDLLRTTKKISTPQPGTVWPEFVKVLKKRRPAAMKVLNKPAGSDLIRKIQDFIGASLPSDFVAYLEHSNGQDTEQDGFIPPPVDELDLDYCLLPVLEAIRDAKGQIALLKKREFAKRSVSADRQIRPVWWHPKWLPFATNGGGDFLCLDFDPTAAGTAGQVIHTSHETDHQTFIADSFSAWVTDLKNML